MELPIQFVSQVVRQKGDSRQRTAKIEDDRSGKIPL